MSFQCRLLFLFGILANLVIFSLNHIVGSAANGGDYTPFSVAQQISASVYDETQQYAPGPARFLRTGRIQAELDVFELRDIPNSYPVLHSVLLGLLAKAMGNLELAWMTAHAILPALIWAVLFWNACRILGSGVLAALVAWVTCFITFGPRNFLLLGRDRFTQPLELQRMPQPALAFLFLIVAIWLLSRAMARPSPVRVLTAGVVAGSLFYVYYFYWIAFFAGAGSLLIVAAVARQRDYAKTVASILLLGCITGIPFFRWTINSMRSGQQIHIMARIGDFTRRPDPVGLMLAFFLAAALWLYCKPRFRAEPDEHALFGIGLLAVATGAAIGLNFQLITGFNAQHEHFYNRALQPLLTYFVLLWLFRTIRLPERFGGFMIAGATALIGILLAVAAIRQIEVGRNTAQYHRKSNPDMDVLLWVRSHLPPGVVIGSNDANVLTLIPGIAGTWTFVPQGDRSMASNEEILRRFLMLGRLAGNSWNEMETALKWDTGSQLTMGYTLLFQQKISPETIETAKSLWNSIDLQRDFRDRRLDYLIYSRASAGSTSFTPATRPVIYQNSAWIVSPVR